MLRRPGVALMAASLRQPYGRGMRVTHLGHACLLVEVADQRLLIDPGTFSTFEEVTGLTGILVTHAHPDHRDPNRWEALLTANPEAAVWVEPSVVEAAGERAQALDGQEPVSFGPVQVTAVGERHAHIHDFVPGIGNRGLVLRAQGEPTLFHPGDALDAEPGEVDILCVPVNAPWGKIGETIAFVRRIAPGRVVPIHDGLLNDTGRGMYLKHIGDFGADGGIAVLDLRGQGATQV